MKFEGTLIYSPFTSIYSIYPFLLRVAFSEDIIISLVSARATSVSIIPSYTTLASALALPYTYTYHSYIPRTLMYT